MKNTMWTVQNNLQSARRRLATMESCPQKGTVKISFYDRAGLSLVTSIMSNSQAFSAVPLFYGL